MANAARLHQPPAGNTPSAAPLSAVAKRLPATVAVRVHQGGTPVPAATPPAPTTPAPAAAATTTDRHAVATMLGVRLQQIEASLQAASAPSGTALTADKRAELERQQEAIKRALAVADHAGWASSAPMVVDATLKQLLGPMAAVLTTDGSGIDRLA